MGTFMFPLNNNDIINVALTMPTFIILLEIKLI